MQQVLQCLQQRWPLAGRRQTRSNNLACEEVAAQHGRLAQALQKQWRAAHGQAQHKQQGDKT